MNLCEAYAKRLQISEGIYSQKHEGQTMTNTKKLMIAKVLDNTNKFLSEALDNSASATNARDMGLYKKFSLNLTTVALPY